MPGTRLLWQLYPSYLLITVVSLLAVTIYATTASRAFYRDQMEEGLRARASLIEEQIAHHLVSGDTDTIDPLCKELGVKASTRITVILPDGQVVGDSDERPDVMDNHADRPEVIDAIAGHFQRQIRYSATLKKDMMYAALPLRHDGETVGVLRMAIPVTSIEQALYGIQWSIALGGLIVAALAAGISWYIARRISRPLEQLKLGAERFAEGDLSHRLTVGQSQEIAALAETMNAMAAELSDRIHAVLEQRNEREAILASMVEAVFAVDADRRLISMNQAGAKLLEVDAERVLNRSLPEVFRNPDLQQLVECVLSRQESVADEIVLHGERETFLQAHGSVLHAPESESVGALVVLHDVTQIKRLEHVRREFVANVSHELKTPITSIKGFVETLVDGAIHNPGDAQRFLEIIVNQTDRLNAIIDDLLSLSRIEQEGDKGEVPLFPGRIRPVLEAAASVCQVKASQKDIQLNLHCDEELGTRIDPMLLEQAVVNLIDNAVKYSPDGQSVDLDAKQEDEEVVIRVRDHGCGIPAEHLPRIFERFYRVDKARSRRLGGTGLGLAIVKHISQAHGGHAEVESAPGEGSMFSVHLPAVQD